MYTDHAERARTQLNFGLGEKTTKRHTHTTEYTESLMMTKNTSDSLAETVGTRR
eukprot:m.252140 g.252140  ORF g.252140 m.252140 type:complete len:54 (-) comp161351_c0_seq1:2-163(-)